MQNEDVRMIIEVDNSQCTADISGINIGVTNTVALRSNQSSTSDTYNVFSKNIAGMPAGTKMVGNDAIKEGFKLMANSEIKPTCSGKLLSSQFDLGVRCSYDTTCDCCGRTPAVGIRIVTSCTNVDHLPPDPNLSVAIDFYEQLGAKDDAHLQFRPAQYLRELQPGCDGHGAAELPSTTTSTNATEHGRRHE